MTEALQDKNIDLFWQRLGHPCPLFKFFEIILNGAMTLGITTFTIMTLSIKGLFVTLNHGQT